MFDNLKRDINNQDDAVYAAMLFESVVNAPEDDFLDNVAIPVEEEKKIEGLLSKIPDDDFVNDEPVSDKDLADAEKGVPDPTTDELLDDVLD